MWDGWNVDQLVAKSERMEGRRMGKGRREGREEGKGGREGKRREGGVRGGREE